MISKEMPVKHKLLIVLFAISLLLIAGCKESPELSFDECIKAAQQKLNAGETEKAIDYYKMAVRIEPNNANVHFMLGELYMSEWKRTYELAERMYLLYAMNNPNKRITNSPEELVNFGLKKGYDEMAISEFKETIKYAPSHARARYYIATNHLNNKRYQEAITEYQKIVETNQASGNVYGLLATAYREIEAYDLAIDSLGKAYKLNSDDEYYYFSLGKVYIAMNNTEKMTEMFNKLRDMKSSYYRTLMDHKHNFRAK